jgi:hypothetical protein
MTRAILDTAYHVAHDYPGGVPPLALRMGKSPTTLSHELTATGTAKLGLIDAVKMADFTQDLRALQAWATHAGCQLVPLPTGLPEGDECLVKVSELASQFGALVTEVTADLGDNQISDNEQRRIQKLGGLLISAVSAVVAATGRRNLAGKPPLQVAP